MTAQIEAEDLSLFAFAETAPQIWERILGWYEERDRSIFDASLDENAVTPEVQP